MNSERVVFPSETCGMTRVDEVIDRSRRRSGSSTFLSYINERRTEVASKCEFDNLTLNVVI